MQYASIIVDHKAGYSPLTYTIPASLLAYISIGSVVLVPVGKSYSHGVVERFVRSVETHLSGKLKPIRSIIYPGAFVPEYLLVAAKDLQSRYAYGLQDVLFTFLPLLPKRPQALIHSNPSNSLGYGCHEYVLPISVRIKLYERFVASFSRKNLSFFILTASHIAAVRLAELLSTIHPVVLFPSEATVKQQREYYLHAQVTDRATVYIGTRGALITPLTHVGGVIIDEPWMPGHKEERTPKLWSALAMRSLCKARNIPLYLASSVAWPETKLIDQPKRHVYDSKIGEVILVPKRKIEEVLTQYVTENQGVATRAIFVKETKRTTYWCDFCRSERDSSRECLTCHRPVLPLPTLTREQIGQMLKQLNLAENTVLYSSEELLQYRTFDAVLAIGFDTYLSIIDFRASVYLSTLLHLLRAQAKKVYFLTSYPDVWTHLIKRDQDYYISSEMHLRQQQHLPPFSLAIQVATKDEDSLTALHGKHKDKIMKAGKIRRRNDGYSLSLLLKRGAVIPPEWHKSALYKVDVLPNYIESS